MDVHGNRSATTLLEPSGTVDVVEGQPRKFFLGRVHPSPGRWAEIAAEFQVVADEPARLDVMDMAGRVVRTVPLIAPGAGGGVWWVGEGGEMMPGVYFVRLAQGKNTAVQRLVGCPVRSFDPTWGSLAGWGEEAGSQPRTLW